MISHIKTYIFRQSVILFLVTFMILPATYSCAKKDHNTVTVIKPKTKKKAYNPKKDKRKKRTKKVRVQN